MTVSTRCSADFSPQSSEVYSQRLAAVLGLDHAAVGHQRVEHARVGVAVVVQRPVGGLRVGVDRAFAPAAKLERHQHEDDDLAHQAAHRGGDGQRHALGHELGLGLRDVHVVVAALERGRVVGLAVDLDEVAVAVLQLGVGHAVRPGIAAHQLGLRVVGKRAVGFADRKRKAVLAHLHAIQDVVDLHGRQQRLKARGADAQLHEPVGIALGVAQGHADVLAQLAGDLVGLRVLDQAVDALQQLAELVALVGGVLAQLKVAVRRVGDGHRAVAVEDVEVLDLQRVGKLLQRRLVLELGIAIERVGGDPRLAQVALVVLVGQRRRLIVGARDGRLDVGGALVAAHRLGGQREQRLHVERHHQHGKESHERQHDRLFADGLVEAQAAQVDVVVGVVAALFVLAVDEDAVQGDDHRHGEEDEQDHAHRQVAGRGHLAFGDGRDVVSAVDLGHAAEQALALERHPGEAAVLKICYVDAGVKRVDADVGGIGVIGHQVVAGRDGEHVSALADAHPAQHRPDRRGAVDQLDELGGILLDDRHRVGVDGGCVVAQRLAAFGKVDLDGGGRRAGVERRAQLVEARVGKVGRSVLRLGNDLARAGDDHHVVDAQQLLVLDHLGIGRLDNRCCCSP